MIKNKHLGAHAEIKAVAWLFEQGFEVFRNMSSHGEIDVIAIKDGITRYFNVKRSYRGGCPTPGVEYLSMMNDGSFKAMGARRPRSKYMWRDETPREKVLRQLNSSAS